MRDRITVAIIAIVSIGILLALGFRLAYGELNFTELNKAVEELKPHIDELDKRGIDYRLTELCKTMIAVNYFGENDFAKSLDCNDRIEKEESENQ